MKTVEVDAFALAAVLDYLSVCSVPVSEIGYVKSLEFAFKSQIENCNYKRVSRCDRNWKRNHN